VLVACEVCGGGSCGGCRAGPEGGAAACGGGDAAGSGGGGGSFVVCGVAWVRCYFSHHFLWLFVYPQGRRFLTTLSYIGG
jgi:hypothetical protein